MINVIYAAMLFVVLFMFIANSMNGSLVVLSMDQQFVTSSSNYVQERNIRLTNQR